MSDPRLEQIRAQVRGEAPIQDVYHNVIYLLSCLDVLQRERDELRGRAVMAEHYKSLALLGRSSYADVLEDKLREQLAVSELRAEAAEAQVSRLTEALRTIKRIDYNRLDCETGDVSEHVEIAKTALASLPQEPQP